MLTDYISPGNRVELKATGKIWMEDDARTKHIYMSKIMDVISDDRIEILMPFEHGRIVLLPVDAEYSLCFYTTKGLYSCFAKIVDRYRSDNMYILVLDLTSELSKLQRREYYRFSCALELRSRLCTKEELEAFEKNRKYLVDPEAGNLQRSVVVDISGGGLRFVANFRYDEGSTIYCSYHLPGNTAKEYEMICHVLKVQELENRPGLFEHRIQYVYIDENSREDIIHFIFEEERKIRKKQT